MSPRGAKKDISETMTARLNLQITDVNSFISTTGHLYLKGADIAHAREKAVARATDGRGQMWCQCEDCKNTPTHNPSPISDEYFETHPLKSEMHHLKNKPWERCDCDHNLAMWAHKCHGAKHGRW